MKKLLANQDPASVCIRLGLAIVFVYAAISGFRTPEAWVSFLPAFLVKHFQADSLLKLFGVYEIVLAIWLVSGWYARYVGALCTLTFLGIIFSNFSAFSITFRDIALAFASLSLVFVDE